MYSFIRWREIFTFCTVSTVQVEHKSESTTEPRGGQEALTGSPGHERPSTQASSLAGLPLASDFWVPYFFKVIKTECRKCRSNAVTGLKKYEVGHFLTELFVELKSTSAKLISWFWYYTPLTLPLGETGWRGHRALCSISAKSCESIIIRK